MIKILLALYLISIVVYFIATNFKSKYLKPLGIGLAILAFSATILTLITYLF